MLDIEPRKVLLAVGDEDVEGALAYAAEEARRRGVGVHVLHAVPPVTVGLDPTAMVVEGDVLREAGELLLASVSGRLEHLLGDLPVSTVLHHGSVVPGIVHESRHAGVVVLQRQRMGRPGRIPTLSVTNAVAAHAHVPVTAVPAGWRPSPERERLVVVGLGDVELSVAVVGVALEQARARGGALRLVHAWQYTEAYDDIVFEGARRRAHEDRLRRDVDAALAPLVADYPDVPVEVVVSHGRPADRVVAESAVAGLVVLGRHRASLPWGPHLGSVVRAVLRESRCPVLVVDPAPDVVGS